MTFNDVLSQTIAMLEQHSRVSFRALKRQFDIDDDYLEDLKEALLYAHPQVVDDGQGLIWSGETSTPPETISFLASTPTSPPVDGQSQEPASYTPQHLAEKILTSRSSLEGERKQVTVMFCDLANSTALAERIGPEAMHTLLNRFFELALQEVHRYEGTINQFLGDGFMALYGAPLALEDHARRGVLAALALQRSLQAADLGHPYHAECQFRIGLNSGLVVVGSIGDNLRMDYSAIGDTTNLAARLQGIAEPGDVVVSESTARLVEHEVRLEALQPVQVKGKREPVHPYKVITVQPRRSPIVSRGERVLSPFVGREREMATLDALLAQVERGHGQAVSIVAEAGQGKSRVLYEFRQQHRDKPITYLEGRCLSYGSSIPYHPVIDIVRHHCGISETDSPKTIIDKVRDTLRGVGMDAEVSSPYILQLLGVKEGVAPLAALTPAAVRARTFETLKQMSLNAGQQQPLILEIEDLHWIDKTSEAYLASLMDNLAGASILLLTTYRPGYRPQWMKKSYATQLSLQSLASQDALSVVQSTRQDASLPTHMTQTIIGKADGNPFFLEELTRIVLEQGNEQTDMTVPDTIQGVLMARLDRLPEASKRLLQTASVLGREFPPSLLEATREETGFLEPLLMELKQLEFLYERTGVDEPIYVFKHALTQDVAYESLLTTRRQVLHTAAGQALERLHHDSLAERYEELGHHFTLGEVWDKAFDYLLKSGDKACLAFANQEAIDFYTQAIKVSERITPALDAAHCLAAYEGRGLVYILLGKADDAIVDFQIMRQLARTAGNSHKEGESLCRLAQSHGNKFSEDHNLISEQFAQEAFELAQQTGDQKTLATSLSHLGNRNANRGDLPESERQSEAALRISRRAGDKGSLVFLFFLLSKLSYWQGHFERAMQFGEEGISVSQDIHDGHYELSNCFMFGLACWGGGHYAQAFSAIGEGMKMAKERQNIMNVIRLGNSLGWFYREFGDLSRAMDYDHESAEMGRTYRLPDPEISALINLGLDYLELGQHERALSYLEPTLHRVEQEAFGAHRWRWKIRLFTGLAELFYTIGNDEQALRHIEDGLREAQATSSQKYIALGRALRGKIIARLGDTDTAGKDLRQAFTVAEQVGSPTLIYPIANDLGQWYETTGEERQAVAFYARAKATIEQMTTAVEDESLRSTLLQSALVQEIHEHATRLGG